MNKLYRVLILLVFFGLGIQCASASNTISFNPQTVKMDIDSSQNVQIVMDNVPFGLAGFNLTISIDPKIAEITAVSFPSWNTRPGNSTVPSSSVWIKGFDGDRTVKNHDANVLLGTITITGKKAGTTNLSIQPNLISADKSGKTINPVLIPGKINISDTVRPIIASVSLNNSTPNTGNPILVTVNATDNVGVSSVKANDISLVQSENVWSGIITAIEGTHTVNVSSVDGAGNVAWNNSTSYTAVTPDTTSPVISSVSLNNSTPNTGDIIRMNVGAIDNVAIISVEASGSPLTYLSGDIWEGIFTAIEGVHSVNVSAKDAAGNIAWNNSTSYTAVAPDTISPVIASVSLNNSTPHTDDSITVTVDTTDNVGVNEVKANDISLVHSGNVWSGIITAIEGTHTVNVSSVDGAGNVAWNNSTSYTAVTLIPPQSISEIQSSPGSTWINWTWTNPDDSNFDHTEIYLNDIFQANTSSEYINNTDLQPETNYTISMRTADTYGNVNETWVNASIKTKSLPDVEQTRIDNDKPEIQSVLLFPANTTADSKIYISANITDNTGVAKVMAGDAQLMSIGGSWQGNITAPSSPGKYSMLIEANDATGNTVNTSVPYSVFRRQGGVKVEVTPIVSKVVAGKNTTVTVKVKNTQNIDDTFKVQISSNGLLAFYRAGTPWLIWTEKTVNLRAKQEVLIPIEVKVPEGTVSELKLIMVKVNSEKFSVQGSDIGYLVISHPRYIYK